MEEKLAAWMHRPGDSRANNWHELVEDDGCLYRHRTFYTVQGYLDWAKQNPQ
jgi:hypothetical protein